jgi:hypothetical protein
VGHLVPGVVSGSLCRPGILLVAFLLASLTAYGMACFLLALLLRLPTRLTPFLLCVLLRCLVPAVFALFLARLIVQGSIICEYFECCGEVFDSDLSKEM